ncbi:phosphate acyltransferase PlsX [Pullulanibacillus sp. KACC 23026]|uniref:phosphate acyltransferase PlsX n=1 Tax=Pullulanibacillus sp. KACC 23026 TaxID=3028315 RepID=UPI0023AEE6A5|nr:phosphate acyltransferase PlsX [Pullulanibacillus sp. KACC 23026]WEG11617.1 phosphate acyltransferase PlsX [Pullulanibacillus sp. KACC 23026]
MRLAIDAMGGDNAPKAVIEGTLNALKSMPDLKITLVGDETMLKEHANHPNISIIHTTERIMPTDQPVRAVRQKKQASMVLAINEVKEGRCDAVISAGNTGALMTAGLFSVGRIKGIDRPALAPTVPTVKPNKGFLLLDAGSNMDAKPDHLLDYAIMGSIYSEKVAGRPNPRIGLLNVGEEPGKGNDLSKKTYALLEKAPINFIGNVEARDILQDVADVIVCDGFSGNIVLKTIEGSAMSFFSIIKETLTSSFFSKAVAGLLYPKLRGIRARMDYSSHGGACLFGLSAPVIKAHGSSNAQGFETTIKQAALLVKNQVVQLIEEAVTQLKESEELTKGSNL